MRLNQLAGKMLVTNKTGKIDSMQRMGRHFVFSGLSASGKTTVVNLLGKDPRVAVVPEHNDWIGGSQNFPKAPTTIEEKKSKQEFFLNIDQERHRWVVEHQPNMKFIISDADFTSPLAHNYAERWRYPDLDIYAWMVDRYCELLERGDLAPASFYVFLDATLHERNARRASEFARRKRNDMFFTGPFPDHMRHFYWILMHPDSPRAALPSHWHQHRDSSAVEVARIRTMLDEQAAEPSQLTDISRLVDTLRSTVNDRPDELGY